MKHLFLALPAVALLSAGESLKTDYTAERTLRIVAETTIAMETTDFSMIRDGEPVEANFGGGQASQETRNVVSTLRVLERDDDGAPTRVRRAFETVASTTESESGERSNESELECPLDGVTLEISLDDGDVVVEVVDGGEPDDDAVLEGHGLTLSLDAFLPAQDVDEGDTWELDGEAVLRALELDIEAALFPQAQQEEDAEGGRGGRGRRGFRGAQRSTARLLVGAEWEAEATLKSIDEEYEGRSCVEIALTLEGTGELEDARMSFGGRRRMPAARSGVTTILDTSYSIEIEGRLLFSVEDGRPLLLDLEGTLSSVRVSEFDRGETSMTLRIEQEGSFEHRVEISVE